MKTMDVWTTPSSYFGFNPVGDYVLYTKTRDSCIMEETNYDGIAKDMKALCDTFPDPETEDLERPTYVYTWSAGHWMGGWVEYLMIRSDAPAELIEAGNKITSDIDGYPVYDDDAYTMAEDEAIQKYWDELSLRERIEICVKYGASIFASRRNCGYSETNDAYQDIQDYIASIVSE